MKKKELKKNSFIQGTLIASISLIIIPYIFFIVVFNPLTKVTILSISTERSALVFPSLTFSSRRVLPFWLEI